MRRRPKSVGTFGTAAQRPKSTAALNMEASESTHLGPGCYNTHLYKSIKPNSNGHKFGTSKRKPLRDTENVPGPGNYKYGGYRRSEKSGYTFGK